jgi:hypothetical protein
VQLGLQLKGDPATDRLLDWGGMCSHRVNLAEVADIDEQVVAWLRDAYDRN